MKRYRADLCLISCGLLLWFLTDADTVRRSAAAALTLCTQRVIPALFPFLVVTHLLLEFGLGALLSPLLSNMMVTLFRLPGCAASPLLLGLAGGYPVGARSAAELYQRGDLTADETQRLLTFCNNSNPVFFISVLGSGVFGSPRAGLYLWLIHVLSALLTGLLFRGNDRRPKRGKVPVLPFETVSLPAAFVRSIAAAGSGVLSVCAFVVFFSVLVNPLTAIDTPWSVMLIGLTELFSLTALLTPCRFHFILAAGCAGWGGLSVLCQTAAALDGTDLSLGPSVRGKLVQGGLSALLAALIYPFL